MLVEVNGGIELKAKTKKEKTGSKSAVSNADCTCELTHTKTEAKIAFEEVEGKSSSGS